jgi:hypothetical protein
VLQCRAAAIGDEPTEEKLQNVQIVTTFCISYKTLNMQYRILNCNSSDQMGVKLVRRKGKKKTD